MVIPAGEEEVADEVAEADGADHLGHALVARRQLAPQVCAEYSRFPRLGRYSNYWSNVWLKTQFLGF